MPATPEPALDDPVVGAPAATQTLARPGPPPDRPPDDPGPPDDGGHSRRVMWTGVVVLALFAALVAVLSRKGSAGLATTPTAYADPATATFGPQIVGTTSSAHAVVIRHSASARSAKVRSVTVAGPDATDFALDPSACRGVTVTGDKSCAVRVRFSPGAIGTRRAVLTVRTANSARAVTVAVVGVGQAPPLAATPPGVDFGSVSVGATSRAQAISLTNATTEPLVVDAVALVGDDTGDFLMTAAPGGCTAASLAPGAACTVTVWFTPTTAGTRTASVAVSYANQGVPEYVPLTGLGAQLAVEVNAATPDSGQHHAFGNQDVGTVSTPLPVTLTAPAGSAVTIRSVVLAGSDPSQFVLATDGCSGAMLTGSTTCSFSVSFAPSTAGEALGAVTIVRANEVTPVAVLLVDGFGIVPKSRVTDGNSASATTRQTAPPRTTLRPPPATSTSRARVTTLPVVTTATTSPTASTSPTATTSPPG